MQGGTSFPKVRRMLLFHAPLILTLLWPASTLHRGHLALATLSPPETDPQILERWGCADEVVEYTFIQNRFHPLTLSSKHDFIQ